ncbi:uncharacterized protein HKW66_Vig0187970 [Vigna angularis]|uniref:Uncharacterized protein n=1 Tax=Phaseolus angularis TaxID=3914 RepID=A0A8T0KTG2_PHAAN|nr:uncharacterized protein HKW66_Vig0187970 [Vigna angularis]
MISISSLGEVMDFRGIGKVEKDFIPLLEEVCSRYPSLVDIRKKRSQIFTQWSFTALGRVFHFLNTKRVRDMQSFPNFKPHVDRVLEMKRLEKNVTILDMEVKTFLTKVDDVKEGFEECDLDVELRYDKRPDGSVNLRATETVKDKDLTIAHADCEKKQEDVATRLCETEKLAIEAGRKLQKNNEDLTLECENMKKVMKELIAHNNKVIQEKAVLVRERNGLSAELDGWLGC